MHIPTVVADDMLVFAGGSVLLVTVAVGHTIGNSVFRIAHVLQEWPGVGGSYRDQISSWGCTKEHPAEDRQ